MSLANAQLYASLERKVADRTAELAEANRKLEQLSVTDALTGLMNRRHLDTVLESEWLRAIRPKIPLAVAMIDIDHFKLYNDQYGHPMGDECLRAVAAALSASVRETDLVARYGGEEFTIVLPDTSAADAHRVADRARTTIADLNRPHARAPLGMVTASIGVAATVPGLHNRVQGLIDAADERLYAAKHHGRNRVMS